MEPIESLKENTDGFTYQRTLFPAPATDVKTMSSKGSMRAQNTHASHVAIRANLAQNISTLRTFHHESTMLQFRCVEIHGRYCDSSTDPAERAIFACFVAIRHLLGSVKLSDFVANRGLRNDSRIDFLMSLGTFCIVFSNGVSEKRRIPIR